jgi:hypothetical protein
VIIRQGIEPLLRARLPAVTGLTGVTDHEAGTEPFRRWRAGFCGRLGTVRVFRETVPAAKAMGDQE